MKRSFQDFTVFSAGVELRVCIKETNLVATFFREKEFSSIVIRLYTHPLEIDMCLSQCLEMMECFRAQAFCILNEAFKTIVSFDRQSDKYTVTYG